MSRPQQPEPFAQGNASGRDDPGPPPSWMGAPAYMPYQELPPHAPMPGAPPYPAATEHPPPPIGRRREHTRYRVALGAAAVWAGVTVALALVLDGPPPSAASLGRLVGAVAVTTILTALAVWGYTRKRATAFPVLVAMALPIFVGLRLLSFLAGS